MYKYIKCQRKGKDKMRKNNRKLKVVTVIVLLIFVLTGGLIEQYSYKYQWKWVFIPWVRIIFHAVAAITISMIVAWIGLAWAYIVCDRMGDWISMVYLLSGQRKKGVLKRLRRINIILFKYVQPFLGAILYITYSYNWERYQAKYYERNIQTVQLLIDIIFSIIGSIIWMIIFRTDMISDHNFYTFSPKEFIMELRSAIELIQKSPKLSQRQKKTALYIVIIVILLIPIWVAISTVVLIWFFLMLMQGGIWEI